MVSKKYMSFPTSYTQFADNLNYLTAGTIDCKRRVQMEGTNGIARTLLAD